MPTHNDSERIALLQGTLDLLILRTLLFEPCHGQGIACRRLVAIPGIGPTIATATIAAIGNAAAFRKGSDFAAWLGVVPGEYSTRGRQHLIGTSRRGNKYLRKLFVLGAHTVLQRRTKQSAALSTGLARLLARKRTQVAVVAVANKRARMVWAVLFRGEEYRPPLSPQPVAV